MANPSKKQRGPSREPIDEALVLHHDAPAAKSSAKEPALKTDASALPKITVKIAACGLLLENELKRQKAAGDVERYGQLILDGFRLDPDEMYTLPRTKAVERAIIDGWIVDMGV